MDIDISSYSLANWLRLRPLLHLAKTARYRFVDMRYRRLPSRAILAETMPDRGGNLLISIGFEDAQLIDWQARLVRRYVPGAQYLVVDNSTTDVGAALIRNVCERHSCGYVRTPPNPWRGAASRSHGLALNWSIDNVVKPAAPAAFGFIDADMFPLELTDPFEPLQRQDFYGVIRKAGSRWFLWAGFCFFRFSLLATYSLDFSQAWFLDLDTGGANWNVLFKHYSLASLEAMPTSFTPFRAGIELADGPLQSCGPWIHEVGQMGRPDLLAEKRLTLRRMLEANLNT